MVDRTKTNPVDNYALNMFFDLDKKSLCVCVCVCVCVWCGVRVCVCV